MLATVTRARGKRGPDPTPIEARFWQHVDRSGGPDACHPWTRSTNAKGYGTVSVDQRNRLAHRIAWQLTYGPLPPGVMLLHRCDNPPCCNVEAHLYRGDAAQNAADAIERGQWHPFAGEDHPRARLTEVTARTIADLRVDGRTYAEIVDLTGATYTQVADILTGRTWRHLDLPLVARHYRRRPSS